MPITENTIIYLDHAATTRIDPMVRDAMAPFLDMEYGNPSALYTLGRSAHHAIEDARGKVARILGGHAHEIIFTGSGTESVNLAILGFARANKERGHHIITSAIEHHAVLHTCEYLEKHEGFEVTYLPVDTDGVVDMNALKNALRPDTILVSIMYANNEIGTIEPIAEIATTVHEMYPRCCVHTDACQAPGYLPLDIHSLGVDLLSLNGSKIYGPKGVGMLYKKNGVSLQSITFGGRQEMGYRPGTENTANIVGFATALAISSENKEREIKKQHALQRYFIERLRGAFGTDVRFNGHQEQRLPNNVHISLPGIEGEACLFFLDKHGICASSGSACTSKSLETSHVLAAIGLSQNIAHGSLRFTFGKHTTQDELDTTVAVLSEIVTQLRGHS